MRKAGLGPQFLGSCLDTGDLLLEAVEVDISMGFGLPAVIAEVELACLLQPARFERSLSRMTIKLLRAIGACSDRAIHTGW